MANFKDHFSGTAIQYAEYRPLYPEALFQWLADCVPKRTRAWDCGTGSGQAATALAVSFQHVVATDPSEAQLAHARPHRNVSYVAMKAEATALPDASMQLVTVAQAVHWFDLEQFYRELQRVMVPNGAVAIWSYGLLSIAPRIDEVVREFYTAGIGRFWPAERAIVDAGLASLDFPFETIEAPRFAMQAAWTLDQFAGYLGTWSAVNRYIAAVGESPVPQVVSRLRPLWGTSDSRRLVTWPLDLRAGRLSGQ